MAAFFVNRLVHMKSYSTWTTWRYGKQRSNKTKRKWYSDTALCATLLKWAKNECGIRFFQNGENQRSKKNVTKLAALAKYKGLKRWFHTQQKKNFIEGYGSKIFLLYKQTVEHWINKRKVSILRVDVQAKKIVAEIDATNGTTQSLQPFLGQYCLVGTFLGQYCLVGCRVYQTQEATSNFEHTKVGNKSQLMSNGHFSRSGMAT